MFILVSSWQKCSFILLLRGITDTLRSFLPKLKKEPKQLLCAVSLADLTRASLTKPNETRLTGSDNIWF